MMTSQIFFFFFFFAFQHFGNHVSVEHDKNIHRLNLVEIGSWGHEIRSYEYLFSPTEIGVNWHSSKQLRTRPICTDFNGVIRYSCGQISGHYEPIHVKFGV